MSAASRLRKRVRRFVEFETLQDPLHYRGQSLATTVRDQQRDHWWREYNRQRHTAAHVVAIEIMCFALGEMWVTDEWRAFAQWLGEARRPRPRLSGLDDILRVHYNLESVEEHALRDEISFRAATKIDVQPGSSA